MKKIVALVAGSALAAYFLDPESGKRRRAVTKDRIAGFFRRRGRDVSRAGRGVASTAYGTAMKAKHLRGEEKPQPNDATLVGKVESEIFRDADVPKGQINVNAENGKVYLRGEVGKPELINDLEKRARKVQGVQDVENLLHLPGTEAPTKS